MNNKKIKIALCLSGEPRSSMFCFPYIYESFIDIRPEYEVKTYIHFRKNFRALDLYNPIKIFPDILGIKDDYLNKLFKQITLPRELKESSSFYENYTSRVNLVLNQILMVDGIHKCFNLIDPNDPPDIVIRCRPDIYTDSKLPIYNIIQDILQSKYDIFIPSKEFQSVNSNHIKTIDKEFNDQIAIGNFQSMFYYSNMVNNLNFLINDSKEWKGERWLKSQLNYYNFKVNTFNLPINLVRKINIESSRENGIDTLFLDT